MTQMTNGSQSRNSVELRSGGPEKIAAESKRVLGYGIVRYMEGNDGVAIIDVASFALMNVTRFFTFILISASLTLVQDTSSTRG